MRIVFMGTPEFAQAILRPLCESSHEILAVVTGPDKPVGRRRRLTPTPVRVEAERLGLSVLTPSSLKDDTFFEKLQTLNADLFVVAAFRILPPRLIALPRLGAINIHTSLLPKYRGAAPIHWAIINGESETGLTSFFLRETIDTGDIILQERTTITATDTYDTLHDRLASMAGPFLLTTLALIERGERRPEPQDESRATRAPKIHPFDALIDFGMPADRVRDFVRGLATRPGAYTYFRGDKIKVHECAMAVGDNQAGVRPGTILPDRKRLIAACSAVSGRATAVEITRVVPAGKQEMDGQSFKNGYRPLPGEVFGEIKEGVQEKQ
jgi:methionyl-tRNA formyltransferase